MRVRVSGSRASELQVSALVPTPLDVSAWHRNTVAPHSLVSSEELRTRSGWPLTLCSVTATTGESLVAVFYRFFEYGAWAIVSGEMSDELLETVRSAEPDWCANGLVTCLAELVS